MSIIQKDGFDFIKDIEGAPECFIVKGDNLTSEINYINNNQIMSIYLTEFKSKKIKDLSFLRDIPHIEKVNLNGVDFSYEGLYFLKNINSLLLSIKNKNQYLDFSNFEKLQSLSVDWYSNFPDLSKNRNLKKISIWKFKPKSKSLKDLLLPKSLEKIQISDSNILNLEGQNLLNLKEFEAHNCKYLESLQGISTINKDLKVIILDYCRKLNKYSELENCRELKKIILGDCGDIPTLKWLVKLKKLNHFSFFNTNVIDGDISYCKGIDYVNFNNKKHYNRKLEEFL